MSELLNKETFNALVDGDAETFLPIIEDLEMNGLMLMGHISQGVEDGSLEEVKKAAHQLKGSTGMLGMENMFTLCKVIEGMELTELHTDFLSEVLSTFQESISAARKALGAPRS